MNGFDYAQYHKLVNNMIMILDDVSNPEIFEDLVKSTYPITNLFGIALVNNEYFEKARAAGLDHNEFGIPDKMEFGEANMDDVVFIEPKVSEMVRIRINAYPYKDREPWDQEIRDEIKSFLTLFYNLIARLRILRMFESRIFSDPMMSFVGNLPAMQRDVGRLLQAGRLSEYTAYRLNISKFSRINRIYGRHIGDQILKSYILKLMEFSDDSGSVYRLGGDNFQGLVPNKNVEAVKEFFEGCTIKATPEGPEVFMQSRVGFYKIENNYVIPDLIMKRINSTFMKTNQKNKILFFNPKEETYEERANQIDSEIMQAMAERNVVAYYQPKVDIATGKIRSVEALCRWIKEGEAVSPFYFIPILERNNHICTLDFYMLRKVCEDIKAWIETGHEPTRISINFSRNNLADYNFVEKVVSTIDEYGIPRSLFTIELTETTLEDDFEELVKVANAFKENGLRIAIDDYGVGFSSLKLIKSVNWDVIKIDKSVVPDKNTPDYDKTLIMLKSIIAMANDIGSIPVVEGVETKEQLDLVKNFGCNVIQGYYYDKPLPKHTFEAKMKGIYPGECLWSA